MTKQQQAAVKRAALAIYLNRNIPLKDGIEMVYEIIARIERNSK